MEQRYLAYGGFVLIALVVLASAFYYFTGNVSPTGNVALVSCSDTDGGPDYKQFGTVMAYPLGEMTRYPDTCADENTVVEYYCDHVSGKLEVASETIDCTTIGSPGCANGACQG